MVNNMDFEDIEMTEIKQKRKPDLSEVLNKKNLNSFELDSLMNEY